MTRNQIIGRLEKLEQRQPAQTYNGVDRFIWDGPKDDAALAAERAAEVSGRLLIVHRIVDPPQRNPSSDIKGRVP